MTQGNLYVNRCSPRAILGTATDDAENLTTPFAKKYNHMLLPIICLFSTILLIPLRFFPLSHMVWLNTDGRTVAEDGALGFLERGFLVEDMPITLDELIEIDSRRHCIKRDYSFNGYSGAPHAKTQKDQLHAKGFCECAFTDCTNAVPQEVVADPDRDIVEFHEWFDMEVGYHPNGYVLPFTCEFGCINETTKQPTIDISKVRKYTSGGSLASEMYSLTYLSLVLYIAKAVVIHVRYSATLLRQPAALAAVAVSVIYTIVAQGWEWAPYVHLRIIYEFPWAVLVMFGMAMKVRGGCKKDKYVKQFLSSIFVDTLMGFWFLCGSLQFASVVLANQDFVQLRFSGKQPFRIALVFLMKRCMFFMSQFVRHRWGAEANLCIASYPAVAYFVLCSLSYTRDFTDLVTYLCVDWTFLCIKITLGPSKFLLENNIAKVFRQVSTYGRVGPPQGLDPEQYNMRVFRFFELLNENLTLSCTTAFFVSLYVLTQFDVLGPYYTFVHSRIFFQYGVTTGAVITIIFFSSILQDTLVRRVATNSTGVSFSSLFGALGGGRPMNLVLGNYFMQFFVVLPFMLSFAWYNGLVSYAFTPDQEIGLGDQRRYLPDHFVHPGQGANYSSTIQALLQNAVVYLIFVALRKRVTVLVEPAIVRDGFPEIVWSGRGSESR
jgi:hypothetical protein